MLRKELPIFPATLFYIESEEDYERLFKNNPITDVHNNPLGYPGADCAITVGITTPMGFAVVVVLGEHSEVPADRIVSILTHEAVHMKQFILAACNEDRPGEEVEAYLVQYYARVLTECYAKMRVREGKK